MHRDLVVAIDGGGTKTVLIIADASCRVLGVGRGGPLNAVFVAEQEAIASVRQAATAALARTGLTKSAVGGYELPVAALYASAPGASPEIISSGVSGLLIPEAVLVEGDEFATHAGALGGDCGVVVLAGTGSFAFGRASDGSIASAGGFGPLLGDEGSAYDIGLSALRLAAMASEGRLPHTTLSTLALDHFKVASWPDLARMSLSREAVAGFAQVTSTAARHGDATAAAVLSRAGSDLGRLGAHVAGQLLPHHDGSLKITLVGGASTAGPCLTNAFADAVASSDDRCMVGPPAYSPCVGALMLALGMVGVAMNDEVIRNMEQSIIDNPELGEYSSL